MRRATEALQAEAVREERLQRALHENQQLKQEVLTLRDKVKVLQVKFKKVTEDLKRISPQMLTRLGEASHSSTAQSLQLPYVKQPPSATGTLTSREVTPSKKSPMRSQKTSGYFEESVPSPDNAGGAAELQHCREALQRAQLEIVSLRASSGVGGLMPASGQPSVSPAVSTETERLGKELAQVTMERDKLSSEVLALRRELDHIRVELKAGHPIQQQRCSMDNATVVMLQSRIQSAESARQQLEEEFRRSVDALTRERDEFALKVRLLQDELDSDRRYGATAVDPVQLTQVQAELQDKSKQLSILTSRMQGAQQQVETLKNECGRLLGELQKFHSMHAETRRQLLEVEGEKNVLQVRCARVEELEGIVQRKSEELIHMEEELLRTASTLQTCNRETEEAVRREYSSRLQDVQGMRDAAEAQRREKERQLLEVQRELGELRRQLELARESAAMFQEQMEKTENERQRLAALASVAGYTADDFGDESVRRALAVAAIKKCDSDRDKFKGMNAGHLGDRGHVREAENVAKEALDMWDALHWDEGWEAQKLREALTTAMLDMELAETRCTQMNQQVERGREMLQQVSRERDALLEENIEMRRRITHVQTVFAKQQLESYNMAKARGVADGTAGHVDGLINFVLRDLEYNEAMLREMGISDVADASATLFFSFDGLQSYDTMLSPVFYALDGPLDIRFCYGHLERDAVTITEIRNTTFIVQLHQVCGTTNKIVAMGELPGVLLLQARETSILERVRLTSGSGEEVGIVVVEMSAFNLLLPLLLGRPTTIDSDAGGAGLSADELRAALVALRSVVALRIQVFRANGLQNLPTPQPYVFYTAVVAATTNGGISCVRDSVVTSSTKAFTSDPVFDVEPIDHRVVVDRELVQFIAEGSIVFVVFDAQATDIQSNLGVAEVSLRPLLASPQAVIRTTEVLHPQGALSIGISWVCRI